MSDKISIFKNGFETIKNSFENDYLKIKKQNDKLLENDLTQKLVGLQFIERKFDMLLKQFTEYIQDITKQHIEINNLITNEKQNLTNKIYEFYTTPVKRKMKVGDVEVENTVLPMDVDIKFVKKSTRQNFLYNENILKQNRDFIKTTEILDKVKIKKAYKELGQIEGLTVEKKLHINIDFKEKA